MIIIITITITITVTVTITITTIIIIIIIIIIITTRALPRQAVYRENILRIGALASKNSMLYYTVLYYAMI